MLITKSKIYPVFRGGAAHSLFPVVVKSTTGKLNDGEKVPYWNKIGNFIFI